MKNKLPLLAMLIFSVLLSCKKNDNSEDLEKHQPITLITKVSGQTSLGGNGALRSINKEFFYDSSHMLVKIKDGKQTINISNSNHGAYIIEYSDSTGSLITRRMSNALVVINDFYPSETEELYYEGDKLISQAKNKYSYANNFVTEVQTTAGSIVQQVKKYTYANNNVASFDDGKGNIYNYKYNDKPNPYANRFLKHLTGGDIDFTSANLVTEIAYGQTVIKLVYTYNEQGYPLTVKSADANGGIIIDYKFEYDTFSGGYY
jgi:hypothetical protein